MKQVSLLIGGLFFTLVVKAQVAAKTSVTVTVYGNKGLQLNVDGKGYMPGNNAAIDTKTTIVISELANGPHTLELSRTDQATNQPEKISTSFTLRRRFDMQISVNANGSLELIEKIKARPADSKPAMSTARFTTLLNSVKNQRTTSGKRSVITNALNNPNNFFSSAQVLQLLQQINVESYRLELAKLSYRTVTDQDNFTQVYTLLNSQASKDELYAFINSTYEDETTAVAMGDADFNNVYQTIRQQRPVSSQMNSLTSLFNNPANYFTADQASRLIQLLVAESNRLQLAKLSYRSITDPDHFNQVADLLSTQASKNELAVYVAQYTGGGTIAKTPMNDADFNSIYQTIQQQWPVSSQMNSLTSLFNNPANYFTADQASRLIYIVYAESSRLQLAKLSYRSITDPANFYQVADLLNTQASKNELAAYVAQYTGGGTIAKTPMNDADFTSVYQTIQQQWPVSAQMNSLTSAFNNPTNYFTAYQASRLIQLVYAESNRLQLAKLSYRTITDPANFNQVADLLSTQASKNELAAYVAGNTGGGTVVKTPMPDDDFNTLYQNIQFQFLPGGKMAAITNAFNNTGYYFTCAQAKKLIEMVTLESNRLQLAKLCYRAITDRGSFSLLYSLLGSQASRDELAAYVAAYKE